jgi:hypothetical protein
MVATARLCDLCMPKCYSRCPLCLFPRRTDGQGYELRGGCRDVINTGDVIDYLVCMLVESTGPCTDDRFAKCRAIFAYDCSLSFLHSFARPAPLLPMSCPSYFSCLSFLKIHVLYTISNHHHKTGPPRALLPRVCRRAGRQQGG